MNIVIKANKSDSNFNNQLSRLESFINKLNELDTYKVFNLYNENLNVINFAKQENIALLSYALIDSPKITGKNSIIVYDISETMPLEKYFIFSTPTCVLNFSSKSTKYTYEYIIKNSDFFVDVKAVCDSFETQIENDNFISLAKSVNGIGYILAAKPVSKNSEFYTIKGSSSKYISTQDIIANIFNIPTKKEQAHIIQAINDGSLVIVRAQTPIFALVSPLFVK